VEDYLAVIRKVIEEHQAIRGHVKLIGDTLSDREALDNLERARADWVPGREEALSERQNRLLVTMSSLEEGLNRHYAFEEKALPPLLGDLLMQALVLEHRDLRKVVTETKSAIANTKLEGASREEIMSRESNIQNMIESLSHQKDEHLNREEAILYMLQRVLEEKAQSQS
jgi:hypothetical protein